MNFQIQTIDNDIIVIDCHRSFNFIKDMRAANQMIVDMMHQCNLSSVHRVYNFHDVDIRYDELMAYLFANSDDGAGSLCDPRIHTVIVGTCQLQQMRVRQLCQDEDDEEGMLVFKTRENAITFCQQRPQKSAVRITGFFTRRRPVAQTA